MAEKLNAKLVSCTLACTSSILYILCAALFAINPGAILNLFQYMFHGIDISKIASDEISIAGFLIGLVLVAAMSLITGWLFAVIYNYLSAKIKR